MSFVIEMSFRAENSQLETSKLHVGKEKQFFQQASYHHQQDVELLITRKRGTYSRLRFAKICCPWRLTGRHLGLHC